MIFTVSSANLRRIPGKTAKSDADRHRFPISPLNILVQVYGRENYMVGLAPDHAVEGKIADIKNYIYPQIIGAMKKVFFLSLLICGLLSCKKELPADTPISFDIDILDTHTKAESGEGWVKGDKVYVFVNGIGGKYVTVEYDSRDWTATPSEPFVLGDFASPEKAILTAIYFPLPVDISYADEKFSFSSGGEKVYTYYLMATGAVYRTEPPRTS